MLGAYLGVSVLKLVPNLWLAALAAGIAVAAFVGLLERFILRKLAGNVLSQVLVTLGFAFIIADLCLILWGGDPIPVPTPPLLQQPVFIAGLAFPAYRLAVVAIAVLVGIFLFFLMEKTRLGAMIRAGVDDREMARAVGIPVSRLFTTVFCLGAALARLEARIALAAFLERIDVFTLNRDDWPPRAALHVHGPESLPIGFEGGRCPALPE